MQSQYLIYSSLNLTVPEKLIEGDITNLIASISIPDGQDCHMIIGVFKYNKEENVMHLYVADTINFGINAVKNVMTQIMTQYYKFKFHDFKSISDRNIIFDSFNDCVPYAVELAKIVITKKSDSEMDLAMSSLPKATEVKRQQLEHILEYMQAHQAQCEEYLQALLDKWEIKLKHNKEAVVAGYMKDAIVDLQDVITQLANIDELPVVLSGNLTAD